MNITYRKVSDIIPYENNPRANEEQVVQKVAQSIQDFGFKVPIVIDENNVIVTGHTRHRASLELGLQEVPVIVADDLDEAQIKAFRIADNRVAQDSDWDFSLLQEELHELMDMDMDVESLGFEAYELENIMSEFEEAGTDPEEEWVDMPEFENEDAKPLRTIYVHFYNEEDVDTFADLIDQTITEKTKWVKFPKQPRVDKTKLGYVADET